MEHPLTIQAAANSVISAITLGTPLSFFVGAGVSKDAPSFLPDWTEFRNAMLAALTDRLCDAKFISFENGILVKDELLQYGARRGLWLRPEVVLQWIYPYISTTVHNMLRIFSCGHPNRNHWTLALLSASSNTLIATCNFDTHIERAIETIGLPFRRFAGTRQAGECHSFREYLEFAKIRCESPIPVLKIHGCVSAPSTIKATIEQVSRPMSRAGKEALRHLVRKRFLVVAGYSGRDSDILTEIAAAAAESKGILWLARKKSSVIPDVLKIPNVRIVIGDLNPFFITIADLLKFDCHTEAGCPVSVHHHAEDAVRHARVIPAAIAISELAMHIGCHSIVHLLSQKIIESSRKRRYVALAWMSLGDSKRRSEPKAALQCFEEAEATAQTLRADQPLLYAHSLKYLAAQYYVLGDLDRALAVNTKGLKWVRKSRNQAAEGRIIDDRALIFRQRGNIDHAIRLRFDSVRLLKKAGDLISLAMVYNNLGKDYDTLDQFVEAERWWRESLRLKEEHTSNSPDIARTCFNIGELLRHTGRIEEALPYLTCQNKIEDAQ